MLMYYIYGPEIVVTLSSFDMLFNWTVLLLDIEIIVMLMYYIYDTEIVVALSSYYNEMRLTLFSVFSGELPIFDPIPLADKGNNNKFPTFSHQLGTCLDWHTTYLHINSTRL